MPVYVWYPLLMGLALGFTFMNIPPVADQFMGLFSIGYAGLSLLLSGLLWSHALLQIPAGLVADRIGAFRALLVSSVLGVSLNLLPFLAPENLSFAILLRFLLGLCSSLGFLGVLKVIATLSPPDRMAKTQGYYGGAFGFGTMLPHFTLPYLGDGAWRYSYLVAAAMFCAVFAATLLLPRRELAVRRGSGAAVGVGGLLAKTLASPDIWMLGLLHGMFYGSLNNLGQWMPSVLADMSGGRIAEWTLATTLVLFLGSCSRTLSGYFLNFISRRAALYSCLLATFALYVALGAAGNAVVGLVLGLALAVACGLCYGAIFTMGGLVLPAVYTGTAMGLLNSVANLGNVAITLEFGYIREHTGSFSWALTAAGAAALLLYLVFRRRIARLDERV